MGPNEMLGDWGTLANKGPERNINQPVNGGKCLKRSYCRQISVEKMFKKSKKVMELSA
jgi:hypothetical protein